MVQCRRCQSMFALDGYKRFLECIQQQQQQQGVPNSIEQLLQDGVFGFTAAIVKAILKREPNNIQLMIQYNVALNGIGDLKGADVMRDQIMFHWRTNCKQQWIDAGRPGESATFPRVMLKKSLPDNVRIEAREYFEPHEAVQNNRILYKILVKGGTDASKKGSSRVFMLFAAPDGECVLREKLVPKTLKAVVNYHGLHQVPDIRKVTADVVSILADKDRTISQSGVSQVLEKLGEDMSPFREFDAAEVDSIRAFELKNAVRTSDWQSVRDFFTEIQKEERSFWMGVVESTISEGWSKTSVDSSLRMSPMLDAWLAAEPNSLDCRLIRLVVSISWAWNARTSAIASKVSRERWNMFSKRLDEAAEGVDHARKLFPLEALVYATGMTIVKAESSLTKKLFTWADCTAGLEQSNDPLCYKAHTAALQKACHKWSGAGHEIMFQYARDVTNKLPDGHPLWVLIPMAHIERVLITEVKGYWHKTDTRESIMNAYRHAFPGDTASQQQATTLPYQLSLEWSCRNYFAYCLIQIQALEEARALIRVIGRRPSGSSFPWRSVLDYKYHAALLGFDTSSDEADGAQVVTASAEVVAPPVDAITDNLTAAEYTPYYDDVHEEAIPVVSATMIREIV